MAEHPALLIEEAQRLMERARLAIAPSDPPEGILRNLDRAIDAAREAAMLVRVITAPAAPE